MWLFKKSQGEKLMKYLRKTTSPPPFTISSVWTVGFFPKVIYLFHSLSQKKKKKIPNILRINDLLKVQKNHALTLRQSL